MRVFTEEQCGKLPLGKHIKNHGGGCNSKGECYRECLKSGRGGSYTDECAFEPSSCGARLCQVSQWSEWSACSKPCGRGVKISSRRITVTPIKSTCPSLLKSKVCNTEACPTTTTSAVLSTEAYVPSTNVSATTDAVIINGSSTTNEPDTAVVDVEGSSTTNEPDTYAPTDAPTTQTLIPPSVNGALYSVLYSGDSTCSNPSIAKQDFIANQDCFSNIYGYSTKLVSCNSTHGVYIQSQDCTSSGKSEITIVSLNKCITYSGGSLQFSCAAYHSTVPLIDISSKLILFEQSFSDSSCSPSSFLTGDIMVQGNCHASGSSFYRLNSCTQDNLALIGEYKLSDCSDIPQNISFNVDGSCLAIGPNQWLKATCGLKGDSLLSSSMMHSSSVISSDDSFYVLIGAGISVFILLVFGYYLWKRNSAKTESIENSRPRFAKAAATNVV